MRRLAIVILLAIVVGIPLFSLSRGAITKNEQAKAVAATLSPTEELIQSLWAQVRILQAVLAELLRVRGITMPGVTTTVTSPAAPTACPPLITRYLFVGSSDATAGFEVTKLQQFLTRNGVYTGPITGYFGPLTEGGLKRFQTKYNIVTSGTAATTGFGATWPKTREMINNLNCTSAVPLAAGGATYAPVGSGGAGGGGGGTGGTGTGDTTAGGTTGGGTGPGGGGTDICPNLSGTQTSVPAGYVLDGSGNCVIASTPPPPPPPPPPPSGTGLLTHLTNPGSGWTSFSLPSNGKIIYVSSRDGGNACNGLSPEPYSLTNRANCPKPTIASTKSLLAFGQPGWILLKKGDAWPTETIGVETFTSGTVSEPRVIGSYGSSGSRPIVNAINMHAGSREHIAFVGLHIKRQADGNTQGLRWVGTGNNILVEDNYIEKGVVFQAPSGSTNSNVKIRRNVIVDNYMTGSNTQNGIFASRVNNLLIEENILDRNGYDNANFQTVGSDSVIPYNLYIQNDNTGVAVRGNISMRSASNGIQMRSGGVLDDNLFVDNAMGITFESKAGSNQIARNVVLSGKDIVRSGASTMLRGWGIELRGAGTNQSTDITNNIIAFNKSNWLVGQSEGPRGIDLVGTDSAGLNNVTVENNVVYRWAWPLKLTLSAAPAGNVNIRNNTFYLGEPAGRPLAELAAPTLAALNTKVSLSNNHYFDSGDSRPLSTWFKVTAGGAVAVNTAQSWANATKETGFSIVEPDLSGPKTIEDYARSIGAGSTLADFAAEAREQQKGNWRRAYTAAEANDYFRSAFRLSSTPPPVDLTPVETDICPNLSGTQTSIPAGYVLDSSGNCVEEGGGGTGGGSGAGGPAASWTFESLPNCLSECPSLVSGKYGQAADFNGSTSGLDAGSPSSIDNLAGLTVSAWIKPRQFVAETFGGRIADKRDQGGWAFFTVAGGGVRFHADHSTTALAASTPAGTVSAGEWTHVAVVWTGGNTADSVTFYINGEAVGKTNTQDGVGTRRADGSSKLLIGECAAGECSFDGAIDNLAIYNRALGAGDIAGTMGSSLSSIQNFRTLYLANSFWSVYQLLVNKGRWLITLFNF